MTHQDYDYRFCLFDKMVQRKISTGAEVTLGKWHGHAWLGQPNKYSRIKLIGRERQKKRGQRKRDAAL